MPYSGPPEGYPFFAKPPDEQLDHVCDDCEPCLRRKREFWRMKASQWEERVKSCDRRFAALSDVADELVLLAHQLRQIAIDGGDWEQYRSKRAW